LLHGSISNIQISSSIHYLTYGEDRGPRDPFLLERENIVGHMIYSFLNGFLGYNDTSMENNNNDTSMETNNKNKTTFIMNIECMLIKDTFWDL